MTTTLRKRMSAFERVELAKNVLRQCTNQELDLLNNQITEFNTNKRVYVAIVRPEGSNKVGPDLDIRTHLSSEECLKLKDRKSIVMDYSHYLALSWPFEFLPLAAGRYSEQTNKIITWRLQIGK